MKALVWTLDDEVAGVIGIVRDNNCSKFFSDVTDEFLPYLQDFAAKRAILKVMQWVKDWPSIVHAVPGEGPGYHGHDILKRLGFTQYDEELYLWLG